MHKAIGKPGHAFRLAIVTRVGLCLAATAHAGATILLHESFGFNTNGIRLDSGGAPKIVGVGIDLGGTQIEFPANTVSWSTPAGQHVQTWQFSASSLDPYEPPSPLESSPSNGSATVAGGGNTFTPDHVDALVDFTLPAGAFTVSADVLPGATNNGGCAIGFTSNMAQLTNNFFSFGQVWLVLHGGSTFTTRTWELHVNGTNGPVVSGTVAFTPQSFPLMLSYDPVTHAVRGSINGIVTSPLPCTATNIVGAGLEGTTLVTAENFTVQTGFLVPQGPVSELYVTSKSEGGGGKSQIDVLRGSKWLRSWPTKNGNELALAVGTTVRTIGLLNAVTFPPPPPDVGAEYTQAGLYTGVDYPMPIPTNGPLVQLLDGASDGQHNYVLDFNNNAVYACDANWANPVVLFTLTNQLARAGITYDPSNNSLWLGGYSSGVIENRAMDGTLLSSFTVGHAGNAALAFDPADGTPWLHNQANLSGTFEQYSRSGTLLMTQSFTNLISRGVLGAEFLPPPRPTTLRSPVRTSSGHYQFVIDGVTPARPTLCRFHPT